MACKLLLFFRFEWHVVSHLLQQPIVLCLGTNHLLPVGDVLSFVDTLGPQAYLDIADCLEPFVFEIQLDEFSRRGEWLRRRG